MVDVVRQSTGELGEYVPVGSNSGFLIGHKLYYRTAGGILVEASAINPLPVTPSGSGSTDVSAAGTISAQQPTANTSVSNATVARALGGGQGTWAGQIIAARAGGLGSILLFEYSEDGGTTWNSTSVRTSALAAGIGSSVTLTGAAQTVTWRGSCSGWTHVRVRCLTYNAGDSIAVVLAASTAADIPTGIALDGTDAAGTNAGTQAGSTTVGVGIRGWLSTLAGLFQNGLARVRPDAQNSVVSTANSSISPLNAGATFTGTGESALGYSEATISIATDQPGTLTIQQSSDNTNWDISDSQAITAATGQTFGASIRGRYYRVTFQNTAGSNQTYLRLQTILWPIGTRQPRTLTALGNLKTAIVEALPAGTNSIGAVTATHGKTCKGISGSASSTFNAVLAVAGKRIKVYSLSLITSSTTAVTVTFKDGNGGGRPGDVPAPGDLWHQLWHRGADRGTRLPLCDRCRELAGNGLLGGPDCHLQPALFRRRRDLTTDREERPADGHRDYPGAGALYDC